jgi:hypothetical protein
LEESIFLPFPCPGRIRNSTQPDKGDIVRQTVRILTAIVTTAVLSAAAPAAQSKEGIKVHGDWTIEVRNPDGTLAQRHEFKNALIPGEGDVALTSLLGRSHTTGRWAVQMRAVDEANDICRLTVLPAPCIVMEPAPGSVESTQMFLNLQVTNPGAALELRGHLTASFNGTVQFVDTHLTLCDGTVSPSACRAQFGLVSRIMTRKSLPSPISIQGGQIVQFTVVLSFS